MHYILGHIKWFAEDTISSQISGLSTSEWLFVVLGLAIGIGIMFLVDKLLANTNKALDGRFKQFRGWVPTVVRWSAAILLIINYWLGNLYAPNIEYSSSSLSSLLSTSLVVVAVLLLFGVYTQIAGVGLLMVYALSFLVVDAPIELLDHLGYVGLGLYLMFSKTGKLSVNKKLDNHLSFALGKFEYLALPLLRIFSGLTLIVLAFSEKLLNLSLANNFLVNHSGWNFLSSFGVDDRNFIILAGTVTILIGLTLILNKAARLSTLALLVTMAVTAALLGPMEVTGHLFVIGLTFAVWVGPNENLNLRKRHS